MSQIDVVLLDLRGSEAFASIHFTAGYWQLRIVPDSKPLHSFITREGVMHPNITTQGGLTRVENFQTCVEPVSQSYVTIYSHGLKTLHYVTIVRRAC